ncbi:MAG TPA: hypothetical protein PLP88_12105, partial [Bacteroidales bacterium]|nr:hypothetical protein [Bacteroidales bacterium]
MPDKHLNIVSFTIPFPPNYGGVIDVYHKLVALEKSGIKIHLHCFRYDRNPASELDGLCKTVTYYPRKTGILSALSVRPYIVESRRSSELLRNLCSNNYPILFEGLHSCYYLADSRLQGRKLIYRESNIEHDYYRHLARAEKSLPVKAFMLRESLKLKKFQHVLKHSTAMLAVSQHDASYLHSQFPSNKVVYLPSFHGNDQVTSLPGKGGYALYHGNLSVAENLRAAEYLIREVFNDLQIPLKIAGLNPPSSLKRLADNNYDPKKAFTGNNSLEKQPLYIDDQPTKQVPVKVKTLTFEPVYTIRKEVAPDLSVEKVVDHKIRLILQQRLRKFGDAKKAFSNLDENPVWLNEEKGISIKRVTITGINNAQALH